MVCNPAGALLYENFLALTANFANIQSLGEVGYSQNTIDK